MGLDDVQFKNCCWGAKTVKSSNPATTKKVRLISGRNSVAYSYGDAEVLNVDANELGSKVLSIWNERVSIIIGKFTHARTVVLIKGDELKTVSIFESELLRYPENEYVWSWNKNDNLQGSSVANGEHRFTWQSHGSQFTIIENVPEQRHILTLRPPESIIKLEEHSLLDSIGFRDEWIGIESSS